MAYYPPRPGTTAPAGGAAPNTFDTSGYTAQAPQQAPQWGAVRSPYHKTSAAGLPEATPGSFSGAPTSGADRVGAFNPHGGGGGKPGAGGEGLLSGPGYGEDWYKSYGNDLMGGPGDSEKLFAQGMAGSNPFYDYATQQATKGVRDAAAGRGGFNSGAAIQAEGNVTANLRGQQAQGLTDLAGQSDASRLARYSAGERFAGNAQDRLEDRVRGAFSDELSLADKRSGLVDNFYGAAGEQDMRAKMAAIEAKFKAGNIDAATRQAELNALTSLAEVGVKGLK